MTEQSDFCFCVADLKKVLFNITETVKKKEQTFQFVVFPAATSPSERDEGPAQPAGVCAVHQSLEGASGPSLQGRTRGREGRTVILQMFMNCKEQESTDVSCSSLFEPSVGCLPTQEKVDSENEKKKKRCHRLIWLISSVCSKLQRLICCSDSR